MDWSFINGLDSKAELIASAFDESKQSSKFSTCNILSILVCGT